ncbi:hypothetical protein LWI29_024568 [Acer saccharum]|uniref:F-box domain-containing protein n=1 Tax=Acer saccharum TaxID=4024 RepID=A0AA39SJN1_ACESA|nr:hypothetical protein LWI29_024568 [Acer saccharum]
MTDFENIPYEVMTLILLKLSVKSLLRLKCVCKTWYALIKSPSFISTHLKSHNNEDSHLVVHNFEYLYIENPDYYDPNTYPFEYTLFVDKTLKDLSYQVLDSQFPIHGVELIGPYDGFFVVWQREDKRIYLWNIATRETRALPKCRFGYPQIYGCGYDPLSDGYKLVFLRNFSHVYGSDRSLDSHVSLYSFNNDSWRYLQVPELRHYLWVYYSSKNSCLNGVCYWLAMRDETVILSFDISSEIFQEINLREYGINLPVNRLDSISLELVNDSLYLLTLSRNEFSIWMMRDGCWTKRFTRTNDDYGLNDWLGYWKDDTIFKHGPILRDLNSNEEMYLGISFSTNTEVYRYNESLVSIKRENDFSEVVDIPWHVLGVI